MKLHKTVNPRQEVHIDLTDARLIYLLPEKIHFDPANPRFGKVRRAEISQDTLFQELLHDPHNATALVESFVENGFILYEPLIVKPHSQGTHVVIEGNRRLAAVKYIRKHKEKYAPEVVAALDRIPSLVFPKNAPDSDIRTYLGIRHLLGFREWPALSKAMFLDSEANRTGDLAKLLREISFSKSDARRFLIPYRLFKSIGQTLPEGEDFWVLAESISRAGIKKFIELEFDSKTLTITSYDSKKLHQLLGMLYGPLVPGTGKRKRDATRKLIEETRDLSKLGKILASDIASTELLKRRNLDEAFLFIDTKAELIEKFGKQISQIKVLTDRLGHDLKISDQKRLRAATRELERVLKSLRSRKNA